MPEKDSTFTVFIADEHLSARGLQHAVRRTTGPLIIVLPPSGLTHLKDKELESLLTECRALNKDRTLIVATKDKRVQERAGAKGWETISSIKKLKDTLTGSEDAAAAMRVFSPVAWRQAIRSKLQSVGILSLPKTRIWLLLGASAAVFCFTLLKLLPSATIDIWPSQETENFTTNVYLATSGATLPVSRDRVRILPLILLTVNVERSMTYDQISKNFTGTNAKMLVTVFNDSDETYSLRKGSRISNQAGMKFRLKDDVILEAHTHTDARAEADPLDVYGEVLGERGNVPGGVKWDFNGLTQEERKLVYARNERPATGGATAYVNVLTKEDIEGSLQHAGARQRLEQELLSVAKQQVEDDLEARNNLENSHLVQLVRDELTITTYKDFDLSNSFVGQNVTSIPIHGAISYTVVLYDENQLLHLLTDEVRKRIPPEKTVVESSLVKENMNLHVIAPWDDDLKWIKITADLTYTQRFILDPLTPNGAKFGKYIRDSVAGKPIDEAQRIIRNLPEVSDADIRLWPPWTDTLPELGSSMVVKEKEM